MNHDTEQFDTSNKNRYDDNKVGVRPDGTRDPNGVDFWWDEEGSGNCWQGNTGPGGAKPTSDPATLPTCSSGGSSFSTGIRPSRRSRSRARRGSQGQHRPARLRLVRSAARAEVMPRAGLLVAAAVLIATAGCGGEDKGTGELRWVGKPRVFRSADLPRDRVLRGTVENSTLRRVEIKAKDLRLVDAGGKRVGADIVPQRHLHGLYPPTRHPASGLPAEEQRRIGIVARRPRQARPAGRCLAPEGGRPATRARRVRSGVAADPEAVAVRAGANDGHRGRRIRRLRSASDR